ncbi:alpha/beta hydrolase family protein [Sphingomonas sp. XXL09]|uniref:alpha/beta hydrolase family protein n=1 Tax=Sphingomonas sp. XXL09 TaxID=3457787 RepID=UPI00406BD486
MNWTAGVCALAIAACGAGRTEAQSSQAHSQAGAGASPAARTLAERFGARETVRDISLSPDGKRVAIVGAGATRDMITIIDLATFRPYPLNATAAEKVQLSGCGWSASDRLVCRYRGIADVYGLKAAYTRTVGMDIDGGNVRYLGRRVGVDAVRVSQFAGEVIDWRNGDGSVLMTHDYVPEDAQGSQLHSYKNGMGVDLVDTRTGKAATVEAPNMTATDYIADGLGNVRVRVLMPKRNDGLLKGQTVYHYRTRNGGEWKEFSVSTPDNDVLEPVAVDGTADVAYAVRGLNGRRALYRVALDGTMKEALVSSNPMVDVGAVVPIGRRGRIIGATYVTDRRQVDYFDPEYRKLAASLAKALPRTPLIQFVGASADESRLLVFASSDVDPGVYYLYNKANRHLDAITLARPELEGLPLAEMKAVTYSVADGTKIPGYLTLPPGGKTRNLPTIIMPHGGPSYRDEWGFDWLVQYFAQAGYAVLQPNFRGSSGYGDAFFASNGFRSWQTAIGDVTDAGRWLIKEGIADPAKLAIVGWSYGGYAALQANVVDPDLFKAAIAIAPVTDLAMTKREAVGFENERLVAMQVGSGAMIAAGSPARHADRFKVPVLMFHGDQDINVGVDQSKAMNTALRRAGKDTTLVVFPKLDHQLDDATVRAKMLADSDAFLRKALKLGQ